jgi:tRNA(Ile)-lysidine synthase
MSVVTDVSTRFERTISARNHGRVGLAVSGGGDSIAMMHLAVRTLGPERLSVFTVDHGLRPEAADEIAVVRNQARDLGLSHHVGHWEWNGTGNLQSAARAGRMAALRRMAIEHRKGEIWLGHTADDQIETFLMRLARGSGVDGLAAMHQWSIREGLSFFRPLLDAKRTDLRAWLTSNEIQWCDDPSNDDARFDRIKARQMQEQIASLGLTEKRVLQTIDHMQAAQVSLQQAAAGFAREHIRQDGGDLIVAPRALDLSTDDAPRRAMAAAFRWMAGRDHRPRFDNMLEAVGRAGAGDQTTLAGCLLAPLSDGSVRISREAAATVPQTGNAPLIWDKRWHVSGPSTDDITVKALGDDIALCKDWRDTGQPRTSLKASPAVWQGEVLIAAPLAGSTNGWSAQIVADFHSAAFAIED